MIRIAFVKYGGLSAGGTEKYLQTLAAHLPKDKFSIDYFYTHATPLIGSDWKHPETNPDRVAYMQDKNINTIEISCEARDYRNGAPYPWVNTNFFEIFKEDEYDIIQTGRCGYEEFPFNKLENSIFVDSIHCAGNVTYRSSNLAKTVCICKEQAANWGHYGGDSSKVEIIPTLVEVPELRPSKMRAELGISDSTFVYGMHQRNDEDIFSPIPLASFKILEHNNIENILFVLLGGAKAYRSQAEQLGIKNIKFLDFNGDVNYINDFVESLDVYAHGRMDGEVCSASIIEGLYHGKPIVTHAGRDANGHFEQIDNGAGIKITSKDESCFKEYAEALFFLKTNSEKYSEFSRKSKEQFNNKYSLERCIERYTDIYEEVYENIKRGQYT